MKVEDQLREAEKMEVIGRLAGGVAHDFNNLLTGILLYCDLLSAALPPIAQLHQYVDEVRLAGEQGAALTQQLLAIARKQVPQQTPILLNDVVASTENLIRRLIGEHIEFVTDLSPRLSPVLADPTQLRQVLINLVLNARDAMPDGGRITVTTMAATRSGVSESAAVLRVQDNGCGMDATTQAHLFEPFFTTKQAGRGTGLGLATVRRIIDESDGAVEVQSKLGHGTRIDVFFPSLTGPLLAAPTSIVPHAGETILLVDDHPGARRSLHHILRHAGYRVHQASNSSLACRIFSEHARDIDLLITDCLMPGIAGPDLAKQLRRQKPGLKVLLVSGYRSDIDFAAHARAASFDPLIHKPFSGQEIIHRIRAVLDSHGETQCSTP